MPGFGATASIFSQRSSIDQSVSETPAAIAGVIFSVLCILMKLYQTVHPDHVDMVFEFLENALVRRVKRRFAMRIVRLARSICDVLPSEEPCLAYGPEPIHEGEALTKAFIETVGV